MNAIIGDHLAELGRICRRHHVARLDVFGSAATGGFDAESSDIDLLVQFEELTPADHADSYFGLMEELEALFGKRIDLLERAPITNPYLLDSIEQTRVRLYDAA